MTALETISHLKDMCVLDKVVRSAAGKILIILASGWEDYAYRSMRDFRDRDGYYAGRTGIDGLTTDGVPVVMSFAGKGRDL